MNETITETINFPYENSAGYRNVGIFYRFLKRSFDLLSSLSLFIFLNITFIFPILVVITAIKMNGNPFFTQIRPGKNGKLFKLIKFRTMTDARDENGQLLPDEARLTKFGKLMRDSSLDELPELLNIIIGDMSVVGPRPQLVRDMVFFSDDAMRRQKVRPGLTGYAQVNGRNNVTWEEKFDMDLHYIDNASAAFDVSIIFQTVKKVLSSSDISTDGMETAEDYGDYLLRIEAIDNEFYEEKQEEAKILLQEVL